MSRSQTTPNLVDNANLRYDSSELLDGEVEEILSGSNSFRGFSWLSLTQMSPVIKKKRIPAALCQVQKPWYQLVSERA